MKVKVDLKTFYQSICLCLWILVRPYLWMVNGIAFCIGERYAGLLAGIIFSTALAWWSVFVFKSSLPFVVIFLGGNFITFVVWNNQQEEAKQEVFKQKAYVQTEYPPQKEREE